LGGTPFLTFDIQELGKFLSGIYFVAITTFLFWVINISLLLLAIKIAIVKKILLRAVISVICCIFLSSVVLNYYGIDHPPPFYGGEKNRGAIINTFHQNGADDTPLPFAFSAADAGLATKVPPDFFPPPKSFFFFPVVVRSLAINLIILVLCELVFMYSRKQKIEHENALLKQFNLEARNNQLKMQLHPHFLFNSLNTLRLLLKKDSDKAEDYLLKLSAILRFSAASAMNDTVKVEEELELCSNYLQMQKVRFGEMLHFTIPMQLSLVKGSLPVYSLQLLAENAIKHNAFTNEEPLHIIFLYNALANSITVKNKLQPKKMKELTTKIGLKNLEERYRLISNEGISIKNSNGEFEVTINILPPNQNT
jgi:hypothetical protein